MTSTAPAAGDLSPGADTAAQSGDASLPQRGDRWLIFSQMIAGVALVAFGGVLAAITKAATHDIGTAIIGVGAALLPSGAAASASARISNQAAKSKGGS